MALIRQGQVVADDVWAQLSDDDEVAAAGDVIVSLQRFARDRETLLAREGRVGVRLASDQSPDDLGGDVSRLALIAVEFPKYVDGRGYSTARLLRERHGFRGELRAVGNVLPDQLYYMKRCGFDSFELQKDKSPEVALEALGAFSVSYQAAADEPLPLYRRR